MKYQKMFWPCGLGLWNQIWAILAQKMYPAISPEPYLQISQTRHHFLQNHEMKPIKSRNLKEYFDLRVWGLETTFGLFRNYHGWLFHQSEVSYWYNSMMAALRQSGIAPPPMILLPRPWQRQILGIESTWIPPICVNTISTILAKLFALTPVVTKAGNDQKPPPNHQ